MPNPAPLIGAAEAAALIGVDRTTFNRWVAKGEISPVVEMPGRTGARLYDADEIERLADAAQRDRACA